MTLAERIDVAVAEGAEQEEARVKSLETLRAMLSNAETVDVNREHFTRLFVHSVRTLELSQDEVAGIMKASRPTVSRWLAGTAAPHRVGRPSVFRELRKVANDKIRQHSTPLLTST